MPSLSFVLTVDEANLVLEALGRMPYRDVHEIVANFRAQAERQLAGHSERDHGALRRVAGADPDPPA